MSDTLTLLRCAAVVACRNEVALLRQHLPLWIAEGLEIVVIDHSSEDDSRAVAEAWLGRGVLAVETLEWLGQFSLDQQLVDALYHTGCAGGICPLPDLFAAVFRAVVGLYRPHAFHDPALQYSSRCMVSCYTWSHVCRV